MEIYLKTRDECQAIVEATDAFYCTRTTVQGFEVEMYDYRLASYSDFEEYKAYELRGLTFIYNPETEEWERHIALQKFFNCNQTVNYMYEDLIQHEILAVQDKRDGSMITFVELPNKEIVAKTKMSFISPQAEMAQKIYETSPNMNFMVNTMIDLGLTPIFELTSPHNQIVLDYDNTELHLLQIRDKDGTYKRTIYDTADMFNIPITEKFPESMHCLDDLLTRKELEEGVEGWVVTTIYGHYKIKTDWYMQLHGLVTEGTRENLLIQTILDDNIDDVIAQLQPGEKKDFIVETSEKVMHKFNHLVVEYKELRRKFFQDFDSNRKEFALKHKSDRMFHSVMKTVDTSFRDIEQVAEKVVKDYILYMTNSLQKAKEWIATEL